MAQSLINSVVNLYDILEVSPLASAAVIKAAYRCLTQLNHPDKHANNSIAIERQAQINGAYAVLSTPEKRLQYDQSLARRSKGFGERRKPASVTATRGPHTNVGTRTFAFRPLA